MLVGSLSHSICAGGGFCVGSPEIVEHQRISGSAYVFSAALPAILAVTASETIKLLEGNPDILTGLRENVKVFRAQMEKSEYVRCTSAQDNPICLYVLRKEVIAEKGIKEEDRVMADIVDEVYIYSPPSPTRRWKGNTNNNASIVPREWRLGLAGQDSPRATCKRTQQAVRLAERAGVQGLCDDWTQQEGGGEGRRCSKAGGREGGWAVEEGDALLVVGT